MKKVAVGYTYNQLLPFLSLYKARMLFVLVEITRRSPKEQAKLVLLWGFAECGNRKALRLKAQGVYLCK